MFRLFNRSSIRKILATSTITTCYVQDRLAKKNPQSSLYWRNQTGLSNLIFQFAHARDVDRVMNLFKVLAPAEFTMYEFLLFLYHSDSIFKLKKLFNKLDDLIDNSQAADVVALGEATLGGNLNLFLKNLLDENDLKTLREVAMSKLITEKELNAFGNLLSQKLYLQAVLTLRYQNSNNVNEKINVRKEIAQLNLDVAGIYLALIVHMIKQDKKIPDMVINTPLTYENLKKVYPSVTRAGELMQIAHDIPEFRYDLSQEMVINKISSNYFLSVLEGLLDHNKIKALPNRVVGFNELPDTIQDEFLKLADTYRVEVSKINPTTSILYQSFWKYEKAIGFFAHKPARDNVNPWREINLSNRIK